MKEKELPHNLTESERQRLLAIQQATLDGHLSDDVRPSSDTIAELRRGDTRGAFALLADIMEDITNLRRSRGFPAIPSWDIAEDPTASREELRLEFGPSGKVERFAYLGAPSPNGAYEHIIFGTLHYEQQQLHRVELVTQNPPFPFPREITPDTPHEIGIQPGKWIRQKFVQVATQLYVMPKVA